MYAVIKTGGKQYKVASGDVIKVEKLAGDEGSEVIFNEVLALGDNVGKPLVAGASVKATILKQAKADKVIVFKKKRRQNYRRKNGHRQNLVMAHKKSGGSTSNGRDTEGRRLGLKKSGGQAVIAGNIIIRQRGTKYHPGDNVGLGKDHTIFALTEGKVSFKKSGDKTIVSVVTE